LRLWVCVALVILALSGPTFAAALDGDVSIPGDPAIPLDTSKVVLLIIDRLGMDDMTSDPEVVAGLRGLGERGGVALMNVRTAAQANSRNGYLTIGTGVRAEAGPWAGFAFHVEERFRSDAAGDVYSSLTGHAPDAEIVHLGIGELRRLAADSDRNLVPGALGAALLDAGKRLSVYGNSDVQGEERRYAALIGMDEHGRVQKGAVGSDVTLKDPAWPGLERTDYDKLLELALESMKTDDLVVVDLGDLARLEELSGHIAPERYALARTSALRRIDAFAASLAAALERQEGLVSLLIVSPTPAKPAADQGVLLAPTISAVFGGAAGAGMGEGSPAGNARGQRRTGLLMSASTKRPGLTMNIDVAPTIARALGALDQGRFDGGGIVIVSAVDRPWEWLAREYQRIAVVHSQRLSVIQPFFFAQMGIMLLGALLIWAVARGTIRWRPRIRLAWRLLLLAAFSFPLALLILSPLEPAPLWMVWVRIALVIAVIVALTFTVARNELASIGLLAGATAAALLADIAFGEPLMADSLLGYSPISGSRFYGIGNEYMGILIGSSFMLIGAFLDRSRLQPPINRRALIGVVAFFFLVTAFLASPRLGINVGGTITAIVGFAYFFFALLGRRFTFTSALLVGLIVIAVLVGIGLIDGRLSGSATHLGQTVQKVGQQGTDPLWSTFERKVSVNLRLIRLTIWSRVVLLSFGVLALFVFYPSRLMGEMKRRYPFMTLSLRGAFVAALATLVVNDSGIVAAATLLLPATLVTLLLLPSVTADVAMTPGERAGEGEQAPSPTGG